MKITVNGKTYEAPEVMGFKEVREVKRRGLNLMTGKDTDFMDYGVGILILAMDGTVEEAEREIEEHVANGGDFSELMLHLSTAANKAVGKSGFFKKLGQTMDRKVSPAKEPSTK